MDNAEGVVNNVTTQTTSILDKVSVENAMVYIEKYGLLRMFRKGHTFLKKGGTFMITLNHRFDADGGGGVIALVYGLASGTELESPGSAVSSLTASSS